MSSEPVIAVEGISKVYPKARVSAQDSSLRELFSTVLRRPWRLFYGSAGHEPGEDVCALRPVDFSVAAGEKLALLGRNGSGKSTLLRILARITPPTTGRVVLRGRVASILEVGTGFHPELTGHENLFLGGAILGFKRRFIEERLPEIVAFAGLEDALDLPVKRYSSGMYVRLAFSLAAHLESEILLIDEVLAVGDAAFREQCLARMDREAASGRTIVLVSHHDDDLRRLCRRGLVLEQGRLVFDGELESAIEQYHEACQ